MGKCKYTEDYRRKHILEVKLEKEGLTDDERKELDYLTRYFNQVLHRFRG